MRTIIKDSTSNVASLYIVDTDGLPKTGVVYNAAGLAVYRTPIGGTQVQIVLSAGNWTEKGQGRYEVDVADSVYTAVGQHDFDGAITDGHVIGERHDVVAGVPLTSAQTQDAAAAAIAAASLPSQSQVVDAVAAVVVEVLGE